LVVLLVRLAVAASVASFLARFGPFLRAIMREERSLAQRTRLALSFGAVYGAGAAARAANPAYLPVDLSFPGALLAGLIGGYWTGLLSGVMISLPSMARGEWMTMPVLAAFGLLGGLLRDLAPDPEEIWRFSPIFDLLAGYRFFRRGADTTRAGFQLFFLCAILFAVFAYSATGAMFGPKRLMPIAAPAGLMQILGYITMTMCVAIPLKIWNSARTERKLESQNRLLVEARLAALTNQINPHFLFNTLNSIASLIRLRPDEARTVIYRLSNILRRLLRKSEAFSPLREELAFVDDYLAIEMTRFGDKLRFEKDIDPATLDRMVPSMLLQPIVENSIKHGLAGKVDGGSIVIRSRLERGSLHIAVEDDGVGMEEDRLRNLFRSGVGVSNVNERLRVLFEDRYRIVVDSHPGEGTRTEIELPELERLDLATLQTGPHASPDRERATPATR
jgi:two-component system LytT family sensor kinase